MNIGIKKSGQTDMRNLDRKGPHDHIVDKMGGQIISGELSAVESLPSESELYSRLGISRTALREALRVLAAKCLVEARPKRAILLVRPVEDWNFQWRLHSQSNYEGIVNKLHGLRRLIAPIAAV
jgi:DNA-binding FadR family transcriptional regulator